MVGYFKYLIAVVSLFAVFSPSKAQISGTDTPIPLSNPGNWISLEDYPQSALKDTHEGTTSFVLMINRHGNVARCEITSSSGWSDLDEVVCPLLLSRAKFGELNVKEGELVPYLSAVAWRAPFPYEVDTDGAYLGAVGKVGRSKSGKHIEVLDLLLGPGRNAGIKVGDRITHLNEKKITSVLGLQRSIKSVPLGRQFSIIVVRNGTLITLAAQAERFPDFGTLSYQRLKHKIWAHFITDRVGRVF